MPIFVVVALTFISVGTPAGADDVTQVTDPQWLYWTLFASLGGLFGALGLALLVRRTVLGDAGVAAMLTADAGVAIGLAATVVNGFLALTNNASEQGFAIGPTVSLLLLIWGAWAGWQHRRWLLRN